MSIADVLNLFSRLSKYEKMELFRLIQQELFPDNSKIDQFVLDIREKRFHKGLFCLHCGGTSIKRNGKYRSRQRYFCKDCGKTFNDLTATPVSGTHYPDRWFEYFQYMVEGLSLRKIAEELGIHVSTAFYWRHANVNQKVYHRDNQKVDHPKAVC